MGAPLGLFALSAALLVAGTAAADGPPTIDIQKTCRASEKALIAIFGDKTAATFEGCMNQEETARDQIAKSWSSFSSADRTCVNAKHYMPSYVEWLTCLEMRRDVRKMRLQKG